MSDFMLPFVIIVVLALLLAAGGFYWHRRREENWRYFKARTFLRPRQGRRRRSFSDPLGGPADPPVG